MRIRPKSRTRCYNYGELRFGIWHLKQNYSGATERYFQFIKILLEGAKDKKRRNGHVDFSKYHSYNE